MARFLVTGGAGFIGSHVVEILAGEGNDVRVLDNFSTSARESLACAGSPVELIESDVRDFNCVVQAAKGVDCIIHEAALPSIVRSVEDPLLSNEVNLTGTLNVLTAAKELGVKRLVFASSSSVYGESRTLPKSERLTCKPLSPYGVQKLCGELYCKVFSRNFGVETVILRYFNVFGPRQNPDSRYSAVIPTFIRKMLRAEEPVIFGDGKQTRDFTYVDNVARATVQASNARGVSGRVFNIASGRGVSLNRLVDSINRNLGTHLVPRYNAPRPGDIRDSVADIRLARRQLGYQVRVSFEEGLARTIDYFKKRGA